jgi:hypothetical protein
MFVVCLYPSSRAFQHGDIVALASDPKGQTGTVVDVNLRVDLELPTLSLNDYYIQHQQNKLNKTKKQQQQQQSQSSEQSQSLKRRIVTDVDAKSLQQINKFRNGVHILAVWKKTEWLGRVEGVRSTSHFLYMIHFGTRYQVVNQEKSQEKNFVLKLNRFTS